eukprot:474579_1
MIKKAFSPIIDGNKKIKSRDHYFLYYKPFDTTSNDKEKGNKIVWTKWNSNLAEWTQFDLGSDTVKQIEATYQGVQEANFPLQIYHRPGNNEERLFSDAQLTEVSSEVQYQRFVLKFAFNNTGNVIGMEQVEINTNELNELASIDMRRFVIEKK